MKFSSWISTHVDKNPFVFLTPVFKDYEKHLKDIEDKYGKNAKTTPKKTGFTFGTPSNDKKETASPAASKPLLGNDGLDAFLVMSSAYYDRTCLWSVDIFTSVWQEHFLFL